MAYPVLSSPPRSFYTRSNSNLANWQAERESEAQAQAQTIEQWRRHTTDFELPPHDCQTCFSHWPDDIRALEDYYYSHEPPHSQIETYQTFDFLDSSGGLVHRNLLTDTTRSDSQRLTSDVPSAFHRVPEEREAPAVPSSPFSVTTDNHAERQLYGSEWDTQHQQVDTLSQSVLQTSSTQDCSGTPDEDREERVMRTCLRIPFPQLLSLDCIPKTPLDQQPAELLTLVMLAIWESPQRRLTLREIRETLMNHFEYFSHRRGSENSWQASVRHMLSYKSVFKVIERPGEKKNRGGYWTLDLSRPLTETKRPRQRHMATPSSFAQVPEFQEGLGDSFESRYPPRRGYP